MTFSSFERGVSEHRTAPLPGLFRTVVSLRARVIDAWRLHRTERAFEGLSYETLKDIGFPSANATKDKSAR